MNIFTKSKKRMAEIIIENINSIDDLNEFMLRVKSEMARMKSVYEIVLRRGWLKIRDNMNLIEIINDVYSDVIEEACKLQRDFLTQQMEIDDELDESYDEIDSDEDFSDACDLNDESEVLNNTNKRRREDDDINELFNEMPSSLPPALRGNLVS